MPKSDRPPVISLLFGIAGVALAALALLFNEWLASRFDPTPPLAPRTRELVRVSQLILFGGGLALVSLAAAAKRSGKLRALLERERVTNLVVGALFLGVPLFGAELLLRPFVEPESVPAAPWDFELEPKAEGAYRIVAVGGSTIRGFPVEEIGVVPQLQSWLDAIAPDRPVEVVNLGRPGKGSRYVAKAVERALEAEVDLVVVLTGHNEFLGGADDPSEIQVLTRSVLRRSSLGATLYRLTEWDWTPDGVDEPRRRVIDRGSEAYRGALSRFGDHLDRIVEAVRRRGVPLILLTPAANEADWPPARPSEAFEAYAAGVRAREEERLAEARHLFDRARNLDPFPWRATDDLVEIVRSRGAADEVTLIDMTAVFRAASTDGIIGRDLIGDNVHPTPLGYAVMARAVILAMAEMGDLLTPDVAVESPGDRLVAFWRTVGTPDVRHRLQNTWLTRMGWYALGFDLPALAEEYLEEAAALDPDDWTLQAGLAAVAALEERDEEARALLAAAEELKGSPLGASEPVPLVARALERVRTTGPR